MLFGDSPKASKRFEARLPDLLVVHRPATVRTGRKLVAHLLHVDRPLQSAIRRIRARRRGALDPVLGITASHSNNSQQAERRP